MLGVTSSIEAMLNNLIFSIFASVEILFQQRLLILVKSFPENISLRSDKKWRERNITKRTLEHNTYQKVKSTELIPTLFACLALASSVASYME